MSDRVKEFMSKWGAWVGPTTIVMILAVLSRLDACAYSPTSLKTIADTNRQRIEALEGLTKAQQQTLKEHISLSESRIELQDQQNLRLALTEQAVNQMREKMARIEDKVDLLVEAGMRRGEIRR